VKCLTCNGASIVADSEYGTKRCPGEGCVNGWVHDRRPSNYAAITVTAFEVPAGEGLWRFQWDEYGNTEYVSQIAYPTRRLAVVAGLRLAAYVAGLDLPVGEAISDKQLRVYEKMQWASKVGLPGAMLPPQRSLAIDRRTRVYRKLANILPHDAFIDVEAGTLDENILVKVRLPAGCTRTFEDVRAAAEIALGIDGLYVANIIVDHQTSRL
jgi:hypothetical protein